MNLYTGMKWKNENCQTYDSGRLWKGKMCQNVKKNFRAFFLKDKAYCLMNKVSHTNMLCHDKHINAWLGL
jgi:hypothetical protein